MMAEIPAVELTSHPLNGRSLIEASAGTGKTWTISHLYLRAVLENAYDVRNILVVTFTNAATQELRGRIRELIAEAYDVLANDRPNAQDKFAMFERWRGDRQALRRLQQALVEFDEAAIYSIHGFCQKLLALFPLQMNALLQQQIINDEEPLRRQAVADYWRRLMAEATPDETRFLLGIWPTGPDALMSSIKGLLKFSLGVADLDGELDANLENRFAGVWWQLGEHWRLAGDELSDFLVNSQDLHRNKIRVATARALVDELGALFANSIPMQLPKSWHILTYAKLADSLKGEVSDPRLQHEFFRLTETLSDLFPRWKRQRRLQPMLAAAEFVTQRVNEAKKEAQSFSYDDLISRVSDAVSEAPLSLLQAIRSRFPLAMVDEFQDTDSLQYRIFSRLYAEYDQGLILIGDPKQAIYSFRGADVFTYQLARRETAAHFGLDTNYRSTCDHVELINRLFSRNHAVFQFEDFIAFQPSHCGRKLQLTRGDERLAPLACWLLPFDGKPISKQQARSWFARQCALEIRRLLDERDLMLDGRPLAAGDIAILVRKSADARLMKAELDALGIRSSLYSRDSVYATEQAREISLLLEVLLEPGRSEQLLGLLTTDLFAYSASDIDELQQDGQRLMDLIEQMQVYREQWRKQGLLAMFFCVLRDFDTLNRNLNQVDGERRMTNWLHIIENIQQQARGHASLNQSLHWLAMQRQQATLNKNNEDNLLRLDSDRELVRIVTIHKSKGLQYPLVFLPFAAFASGGGSRPDSYVYHDANGERRLAILDDSHLDSWRKEELAEEIRLFYVAMTRAEYRCYIGWGHVSGAGDSALAQCLYADCLKKGRSGMDLDLQQADQLSAPLLALNRQRALVEILPPDPPLSQVGKTLPDSVDRLSARRVKRVNRSRWRISSYSHLAMSGQRDEDHGPDHDALPLSADDAEAVSGLLYDPFHFPKGTRAGSFLHELLENIDFQQPVEQQMLLLKCREYGYDEAWSGPLKTWLEQVLACPLQGFSLNAVASGHRLVEMEFYMAARGLKAQSLNRLLRASGYSEVNFEFADLNGFLKGFIDLVFEYDGRFFIADYKSNHLGNDVACYDEPAMRRAMLDHHYHLQYLIYTLALHRYLAGRIQGYDYDIHIGGVFYLFLRGMGPAGHGVFFERPQRAFIEALDRLLGGSTE